MTSLAKQVARILLVMGLGPNPSAAMGVDENQCNVVKPNALNEPEGAQLVWWMVLFSMLATLIWVVFFWHGYKWLKETWTIHQHLCLEVAQSDFMQVRPEPSSSDAACSPSSGIASES